MKTSIYSSHQTAADAGTTSAAAAASASAAATVATTAPATIAATQSISNSPSKLEGVPEGRGRVSAAHGAAHSSVAYGATSPNLGEELRCSATLKRTRFALRLVLILLASACLSACATDDAISPDADANPLPVSFCATVQSGSDQAVPATMQSGSTPATRTASGGDQWLLTDRIGIIMTRAGSGIGNSGEGVLPGGDNIPYAPANISTDDDGHSAATFAPADPGAGPMYYPATGNVDFYAYYPYAPKGDDVGQLDENYSFKIDLTDQSNPAAIDVLYARVKNAPRSATPVNLSFRHVLAKVTLRVTAGDGISQADVAALKAGDVQMEIDCTVNIMIGAPKTEEGVIVTGYGVIEAVSPYRETNAPQGADVAFSYIVVFGNHDATPVTFTLNGTTYTATLPAGQWRPGTNYVYPLTIRRTGITVGTPTVAAWTQNAHNDGTGDFSPVDLKDFVTIPAGTFIMGSPETEEDRAPNEQQHEVTLTHGFRMARYETTNAQYATFLNAIGVGSDGKCPAGAGYPAARHPGMVLVNDCTKEEYGRAPYGVTWDAAGSQWKPMDGYADCPAIFVTWYGADEYVRRLGASLPTEAQWEYACRAGTTTAFSFGNDEDGLRDYGWYLSNSNDTPHPVGTKQPNAWGLYDMHGNAWEWCLDSWGVDYSADPAIDPVSPFPSTQFGRRVRRGGAYGNSSDQCRSAYRQSNLPGDSFGNTGFRIVFN